MSIRRRAQTRFLVSTQHDIEQALSDGGHPVPAGSDVHVESVSYWDTGSSTYVSCAAVTTPSQLQRLQLKVMDGKGVERTLVVAKRGPLHISHPLTATAVPPTGAFGDPALALKDSATLSGGMTPTGTITFSLYSPEQFADGICTGAPIATRTVPVSGNGTYHSEDDPAPVSPEPIHATQAGTYRWIASYSGDSINQGLSTVCDQPGQTVVVSPGLAVEPASPPATDSQDLVATATLSGTTDPGGHMTFHLFGPSDTSCDPVRDLSDGGVVTVTGNATTSMGFHSPPLSPGVYHWTADYSGDDKYHDVAVGCAHAGLVMVKTFPTVTVTLTQDGATISAAVTVVGTAPTGTVTFSLYDSADASCSGTPAHPFAPQDLSSGAADSGPFVAPSGTYHWGVTYSGDAQNTSVTNCDPATVTVS